MEDKYIFYKQDHLTGSTITKVKKYLVFQAHLIIPQLSEERSLLAPRAMR